MQFASLVAVPRCSTAGACVTAPASALALGAGSQAAYPVRQPLQSFALGHLPWLHLPWLPQDQKSTQEDMETAAAVLEYPVCAAGALRTAMCAIPGAEPVGNSNGSMGAGCAVQTGCPMLATQHPQACCVRWAPSCRGQSTGKRHTTSSK